MQNCPHCSTSMEIYATVCPGCGSEKRTELSFYFNWLGFLIGWDKPIISLGVSPFLLAETFKIALLVLLTKKIIKFRKLI